MNAKNEEKVDQEEIGRYEKLASRTADLIEEGKKTFDEALKKAKEELSSAGDFSRERRGADCRKICWQRFEDLANTTAKIQGLIYVQDHSPT